jgi:hypothetical protein
MAMETQSIRLDPANGAKSSRAADCAFRRGA